MKKKNKNHNDKLLCEQCESYEGFYKKLNSKFAGSGNSKRAKFNVITNKNHQNFHNHSYVGS